MKSFAILSRSAIKAVALVLALTVTTGNAATPTRKPVRAKRILLPPPVLKPPSNSPFSAVEPADSVLTVKVSEDGKTIFLAGEIAPGSYRKFSRILGTAANVETVHLGSPGGIVMEGFLIAALIREKKLKTYSEVHCSSSCTQILVSGIDRAVSPKAVIGFHKSAALDMSGEVDSPENEKQDKSAQSAFAPKTDKDLLFKLPFQRAGVAKEFIERAFATPHEDVWKPSIDELLKAGVLTRRSMGDEYVVPAGIGISRQDAESSLLAEPVWRLLQARHAELFAESTVNAMRMTQVGVSKSEALRVAMSQLTGKLGGDISRAPDGLVEEFLTLTHDQMNAAPEMMFPSCARVSAKPISKLGELPAELVTREKKLIEQLLSAPITTRPMKVSKAYAILNSALGPASAPGAAELHGDALECAESKFTITRLLGMEMKARLKAFRALLAFAEKVEE